MRVVQSISGRAHGHGGEAAPRTLIAANKARMTRYPLFNVCCSRLRIEFFIREVTPVPILRRRTWADLLPNLAHLFAKSGCSLCFLRCVTTAVNKMETISSILHDCASRDPQAILLSAGCGLGKFSTTLGFTTCSHPCMLVCMHNRFTTMSADAIESIAVQGSA